MRLGGGKVGGGSNTYQEGMLFVDVSRVLFDVHGSASSSFRTLTLPAGRPSEQHGPDGLPVSEQLLQSPAGEPRRLQVVLRHVRVTRRGGRRVGGPARRGGGRRRGQGLAGTLARARRSILALLHSLGERESKGCVDETVGTILLSTYLVPTHLSSHGLGEEEQHVFPPPVGRVHEVGLRG